MTAPRFADLRNGGNMRLPRPPRWSHWQTVGVIVSGLLLAVMAVILEGM